MKRIRKQSPRKLCIMMWNLFRILFLKVLFGNKIRASVIQNISPKTVIGISKGGKLFLSHSIYTRENVSFRVEGGSLRIGTCFFNQGCMITALKNIEIGNGCLFGPNVVVVDHDHDYHYRGEDRSSEYLLEDIIIEDDVIIGANSVVLKGTHIGCGCIIGAGSIVKGNIPEGTMYYQKAEIITKKISFVDK